jgi:hypothetical protein
VLLRWHSEAAQNGFLVGLVGDAKAGLESNLLAEFAQQLGAEGVDGPALHALHARAELASETLGNFTGGLVREGEDADAVRLDAELVDQECDPLDEAEGFSRARAREDQQRLRRGLDGKTLRGRGSVRNRNGVGAYRRRLRSGPWVRSRGSVRARGRGRQDVL